jgi:hypothetical protein
VAQILEQTASGRGVWNPSLGYGVVDVAAAVAAALGTNAPAALPSLRAKARLGLSIRPGARRLRVSARLRSLMPAISPARRVVRLQAKRGAGWRTLATARTNAAGRVHWALRPGEKRLRVRYLGAADLTAVSSRLVRVQV